MFFEKVTKNTGFNCYAFMVDYENMGLPWPDGYETSQVNGQAPIAVNDNYLFFAKDDSIHMLDFGGFKEQTSSLPPGTGATFNKAFEAVALKNEEKENTFQQLENLITAMETVTRAKHGENDLDDMTLIMIAGMLEGLMSKLSQSKQSYTLAIVPDELTPSRNGLSKMQMHINAKGQEVTLEQVLDDIDGEAFRPSLTKMQLANIDLYSVWADWSQIPSDIRPTGYEGATRCPVGINNNDVIFCMNGMIIQLNVMNGHVNKLAFNNVMPKLTEAANQSEAYFNDHNLHLEKFMGDLISYALNGAKDLSEAGYLINCMDGIWGPYIYRISVENIPDGRGQFVSVRGGRPVTLEDMIETL